MFKELFTEDNKDTANKIKKALRKFKVVIVSIGSGTADIVITTKDEKSARKISPEDISKLISKEIPSAKYNKNTKSDLYYDGVPTIQAANWKDEDAEWEIYIPIKY